MRTVMGVGLVLCGILVIVSRGLRFLFWSRVRTVNPALWTARSQSWQSLPWTSVISRQRFSTTRVLFSTWKRDWEPEFGVLADRQLNRLAGLLRGFFLAMAGLFTCLFVLAFVYEVWSKF